MMASEPPRAPLSVYMLADHLDAALAAGEDLVLRGGDWRQLLDTPGNMQTFPQRQRAIVETIRALELMVVARILKARDHARALGQRDTRFAMVANLFSSGTAVLLDAVEGCGDATANDFDTGDGLISYVRGRGLIAPNAAGIQKATQLTIDDSFMLCGQATLGPLMDMAAAFLDALEAHFNLFVIDDEHAEVAELPDHSELDDVIDMQIAASRTESGSDLISTDTPPNNRTSLSSPISWRGAVLKEFNRRTRMPLN